MVRPSEEPFYANYEGTVITQSLEGCLGRTKYIIVVSYIIAMREVSADQVCQNQNRALGE